MPQVKRQRGLGLASGRCTATIRAEGPTHGGALHEASGNTVRRLLAILFCLLCLPAVARATAYYIANSGNDTNTGTSASNPWATLAKAESSAGTGDTVLLKRGDIWREQFTIPAGGMTVGAYGTGAKPVICGSDVSSGAWTQDAGNVYFQSAIAGPVYQVFRNGEWVHLAHEPDTPGSYYTDNPPYYDTRWQVYETGDDMPFDNSQIAGATLIGLTAQWFRNVYEIDSYSGSTIYLVDDGRLDTDSTRFKAGYWPDPNRYWLANKRLFLDSENEWFRDGVSDRLYVYQPGGGSPTGTWELIRRTYGIYAEDKDNLLIQDIEIRHTLIGLHLKNCLDFDVHDVAFNDIGTQTYRPGYESTYVSTGIYIWGNDDRPGESGTIRSCRFNNVLRESIMARDYGNLTVIDNTIVNSATIGEDVGFGPHGGSNAAIHYKFATDSPNGLIQSNHIEHCGYLGIWPAAGALVESNRIINSMMYLGDGGAIYAGANSPVLVRHNHIDTTGNGGFGGTKCGVYLDSCNSDCVVVSNTILNAGTALFNHRGSNNHWHANLCVDYRERGFSARQRSEDPALASLEFKNNRLSSVNEIDSHILLNCSATGVLPHADWFDSTNDCDDNTYYPDGASNWVEAYPGPGYIPYDFAGWQAATGLDAHSLIRDVPTRPPSSPTGLRITR